MAETERRDRRSSKRWEPRYPLSTPLTDTSTPLTDISTPVTDTSTLCPRFVHGGQPDRNLLGQASNSKHKDISISYQLMPRTDSELSFPGVCGPVDPHGQRRELSTYEL